MKQTEQNKTSKSDGNSFLIRKYFYRQIKKKNEGYINISSTSTESTELNQRSFYFLIFYKEECGSIVNLKKTKPAIALHY